MNLNVFLPRTDRIPVLFVFGREAISIDDCCESFKSCFPDLDCKILVIYDTVYDHAIGKKYYLYFVFHVCRIELSTLGYRFL